MVGVEWWASGDLCWRMPGAVGEVAQARQVQDHRLTAQSAKHSRNENSNGDFCVLFHLHILFRCIDRNCSKVL